MFAREVSAIRSAALALHEKGWARGAGGNISVRVEPGAGEPREWERCPWPVPKLGGCSLLITEAGKSMEQVAEDPEGSVLLISLSANGRLWGRLRGHGRPTSELAAHLLGHEALVARAREQRALVHAHPPGVIRLSRREDLVRGLCRSYPDRIAVVGSLPPGSRELGLATAGALGISKIVLWRGHGLLAAGESPGQAVSLIGSVEEAARALLREGRG